MKKIMLFLIIFCTILFNQANAQNYQVSKYDVRLTVSEYNVVKVFETISVNFLQPSKGIVRDIPITTGVIRNDGTTFTNHASISDIQASEEYQTYHKSGFQRFDLGNSGFKVFGPHKYIFLYNYNRQKSNLKNKDEFFYNIISNTWDTTIDNVKFSVKMPKNFDAKEVLIVLKDKNDEPTAEGISYTVKDNSIEGTVSRQLQPRESVMVKINLPKGYFKNGKLAQEIFSIISAILFTLASFLIWFIFRTQKSNSKINYYPPNKLNSAEVGAIYSETASAKDIISLLFYLGSKGYLKIDYKNDDFKITKLKDYQGAKKKEKIFLNALFKQGNVVTKNDLAVSKEFYKECGSLIGKIDKNVQPMNVNEISRWIKAVPMIAITAVVSILFYIITGFSASELTASILNVIIAVVGIIVPVLIFRYLKSTNLGPLCIIGMMTYFIIFFYAGFLFLPQEYTNTVITGENAAISVILCLIINMLFLYKMPSKSSLGLKYLTQILSFKKFLENSREEELKELLSKDSSYFSKILSFAYAIGLLDLWSAKFDLMEQNTLGYFEGEVSNTTLREFSELFADLIMPSSLNGGF